MSSLYFVSKIEKERILKDYQLRLSCLSNVSKKKRTKEKQNANEH